MALALRAGRRFLLFVELKCDAGEDSADPQVLADAAYDVIRQGGILESVCLSVSTGGRLARIRERAPEAARWFTTDKLAGAARPVIDMIAAAGAQGWFPNFADATPENVAYARECGLKVGAWTVNRRDDMERLKGLEAICTDRPDILSSLNGRP